MPEWLSHPHAMSVLAAYGVAAVILLGLLVATLRDWQRAKDEAKRVQREP